MLLPLLVLNWICHILCGSLLSCVTFFLITSRYFFWIVLPVFCYSLQTTSFSAEEGLYSEAWASFIFFWTKSLGRASFSGISISLAQNHFNTVFGPGQIMPWLLLKLFFSFMWQAGDDPSDNFCLYARNTSGSSIFLFFRKKKKSCFLA